jgi:transcriptional regulator with XRE-family HTH domain
LGRRRLAGDLRRHRMLAQRTIAEVAEHLECSPAKISRIETGAVGVRVQDLRALVELYDITDTEREQLYTLVRQARQRGWWHEFADVYPAGSETLYGLEHAAAAIQVHSPSLIPGLLQTERYARALISTATDDQDVIARRVELRMRRQQLLTRPHPATLHAILDQAVLHHVIGDRDTQAEQLQVLLDSANRGNVVVQVIGFDAGAHPGAGVAFSMFDFDIPTVAPVAYQEQLIGNTYLDEPDQVEVFQVAWRAARNAAASPQRSHELIASHLAGAR